ARSTWTDRPPVRGGRERIARQRRGRRERRWKRHGAHAASGARRRSAARIRGRRAPARGTRRRGRGAPNRGPRLTRLAADCRNPRDREAAALRDLLLFGIRASGSEQASALYTERLPEDGRT